MKMTFCTFNTPLGPAAIVFRGQHLARVYLPERSIPSLRRRVHADFPDAEEDQRAAADLLRSLQRYFEGKRTRFRVKLDFSQTGPFTRQVLNACLRIPAGRTVSYRELAELLGKPQAWRAVGQALRRNPFPIIIPCHRVVGSDGSLRGYGGQTARGLRLKRFLLRLENSSPGPTPRTTKAVSR
jgi:methylated-DNA-[protein]-cysteine S-methyltransferase